jgi:vitamin B12 transporter
MLVDPRKAQEDFMTRRSVRRALRAGAIPPIVVATLTGGLGSLPSAAQPVGARAKPDEIIVTSSILPTPRRQIGTAVSVIDNAELELRGYDSLADALRTQTGVGVTNTGGAGKQTALRIRGEDGYRTLLLIDGVKAMDPSGTQALPSFESVLATRDLERVEILRGPQGFMYGADAGGVVNVISNTGRGGFGGRFAIEQGKFDTHKVEGSVSGGNDRGDFYLSGTDLSTDGFSSQTADTELRDDDGAENTTVHTKLGWNATDNVRLQLVARTIHAAAMYDGCFSFATFSTVHDCLALTDQTTYKLSAEIDSGKLTNSFGYSDVDVVRDSLTEGSSTFATHGDLSRLEYTGSFAAADSTTFAYGVDLQTEEVAGSSLLERDQTAYYAEYQGRFGDRLFLSVGARYDDNDDFGTHVSKRVSAAYVQDLGGSRSLKYRASYGTGFRAPSLYEIAYNRDPFSALPPALGFNLAEEHSEGYDVGVELDTANGLHLEATYFDQRITDEIFFDLDTFSGYLQSAGESESTGVELGAALPVGERWQLIANWTNNDATNTTSQPRLRRPKNLANFGVLYNAPSNALKVSASYRLARDAVDVGNVALDDYEVLDASVSYAVNASFEVFARLQNVTDESYREAIGFNTAGREAYAGARFRF